MRIYSIIFAFLLSLTGCFDLDLRPPDSVTGEVIGCKTEGTDLFCLTRYPGGGTEPASEPTEPIPIEARVYVCEIDGESQVYDGDTLSDVRIQIAVPTLLILEELGEVFPGIYVKADGVYIQDRVRIAGIDTPEMRPSINKSDGTSRSETSRANEKKAAIAARLAVVDLLEKSGWTFTLTDVGVDTFGRVLGTVFAGDVNVGKYLIENRHALPYDGGTKVELDWDVLDQGFVR